MGRAAACRVGSLIMLLLQLQPCMPLFSRQQSHTVCTASSSSFAVSVSVFLLFVACPSSVLVAVACTEPCGAISSYGANVGRFTVAAVAAFGGSNPTVPSASAATVSPCVWHVAATAPATATRGSASPAAFGTLSLLRTLSSDASSLTWLSCTAADTPCTAFTAVSAFRRAAEPPFRPLSSGIVNGHTVAPACYAHSCRPLSHFLASYARTCPPYTCRTGADSESIAIPCGLNGIFAGASVSKCPTQTHASTGACFPTLPFFTPFAVATAAATTRYSLSSSGIDSCHDCCICSDDCRDSSGRSRRRGHTGKVVPPAAHQARAGSLTWISSQWKSLHSSVGQKNTSYFPSILVPPALALHAFLCPLYGGGRSLLGGQQPQHPQRSCLPQCLQQGSLGQQLHQHSTQQGRPHMQQQRRQEPLNLQQRLQVTTSVWLARVVLPIISTPETLLPPRAPTLYEELLRRADVREVNYMTSLRKKAAYILPLLFEIYEEQGRPLTPGLTFKPQQFARLQQLYDAYRKQRNRRKADAAALTSSDSQHSDRYAAEGSMRELKGNKCSTEIEPADNRIAESVSPQIAAGAKQFTTALTIENSSSEDESAVDAYTTRTDLKSHADKYSVADEVIGDSQLHDSTKVAAASIFYRGNAKEVEEMFNEGDTQITRLLEKYSTHQRSSKKMLRGNDDNTKAVAATETEGTGEIAEAAAAPVNTEEASGTIPAAFHLIDHLYGPIYDRKVLLKQVHYFLQEGEWTGLRRVLRENENVLSTEDARLLLAHAAVVIERVVKRQLLQQVDKEWTAFLQALPFDVPPVAAMQLQHSECFTSLSTGNDESSSSTSDDSSSYTGNPSSQSDDGRSASSTSSDVRSPNGNSTSSSNSYHFRLECSTSGSSCIAGSPSVTMSRMTEESIANSRSSSSTRSTNSISSNSSGRGLRTGRTRAEQEQRRLMKEREAATKLQAALLRRLYEQTATKVATLQQQAGLHVRALYHSLHKALWDHGALKPFEKRTGKNQQKARIKPEDVSPYLKPPPDATRLDRLRATQAFRSAVLKEDLFTACKILRTQTRLLLFKTRPKLLAKFLRLYKTVHANPLERALAGSSKRRGVSRTYQQREASTSTAEGGGARQEGLSEALDEGPQKIKPKENDEDEERETGSNNAEKKAGNSSTAVTRYRRLTRREKNALKRKSLKPKPGGPYSERELRFLRKVWQTTLRKPRVLMKLMEPVAEWSDQEAKELYSKQMEAYRARLQRWEIRRWRAKGVDLTKYTHDFTDAKGIEWLQEMQAKGQLHVRPPTFCEKEPPMQEDGGRGEEEAQQSHGASE